MTHPDEKHRFWCACSIRNHFRLRAQEQPMTRMAMWSVLIPTTLNIMQTNFVTTSYDYDALHRQTAVILAAGTPLERKAIFHYDEAGNVIEKIHANHLREVMEYDALNRLTHTTFDRTAVDVQAPVLGA